MTSTGPTPDPDPSELPPRAPYAAPYVPPQSPPSAPAAPPPTSYPAPPTAPYPAPPAAPPTAPFAAAPLAPPAAPPTAPHVAPFAAPPAAPHVPSQPGPPAPPATTAWPAAEVPPHSPPPVTAWAAAATPPQAPAAWPAAEPPGAPRQAQQYLDQTRSFVRGVSERVRTADRSQLARRGREAGMRHVRQVRESVGAIDTGRVAATAGQVGRTAAAHGALAARRTVSAVGEFGTGIATFWRGLWAFVKRPRLWLYAVLPAAILYALTVASEAAVSVATRRVAEWVAGLADGWWSVLQWAIEWTVHWGISALAFTVMGFLVIPFSLLVGAPFYVLIVRSLERRLDPAGPPAAAGWVTASGFVMSQTVLLTLVVMFGGLVVAPVLLIPGVNLLAATVIAVVLNGFVVGLIAVGLPLHHRGVTGRRDHLRYAWRNRWAIVGFGGMSVLVLSIPFAPLRWVSVPAVFVGAVLLQRRFPAVPSTAPQPTAPPPNGAGFPPGAPLPPNAGFVPGAPLPHHAGFAVGAAPPSHAPPPGHRP